jgi:hypothetical protein
MNSYGPVHSYRGFKSILIHVLDQVKLGLFIQVFFFIKRPICEMINGTGVTDAGKLHPVFICF